MQRLLPTCPYLPEPDQPMDWRSLNRHGNCRDAEFYATALTYGQYLWRHRLPARAILCLDRAFGAELQPGDPVLNRWPLPYAAMAWILRQAPPGAFLGNPRVHFQHLADRVGPPRREQRRWRAWACWALTRAFRPEFPGDSGHPVSEPTLEQIEQALLAHGLPGEAELCQAALAHPSAQSHAVAAVPG